MDKKEKLDKYRDLVKEFMENCTQMNKVRTSLNNDPEITHEDIQKAFEEGYFSALGNFIDKKNATAGTVEYGNNAS